jgi:hypothetical protein
MNCKNCGHKLTANGLWHLWMKRKKYWGWDCPEKDCKCKNPEPEKEGKND